MFSILNKVTEVLLKDINSKAVHGSVFTTEDINGGNCYNWAAIIKTIIPQAELCTVARHGGHAFIRLDSLYYDAEALNGVIDWRLLPSFKGIKRKIHDHEMEIQTEIEFYKKWKINKKYITKLRFLFDKHL